MAPKLSKFAVKFEYLIKEIKLFEANIQKCDNNETRIKILRTKIVDFETKLEDIFSQLSNNETDNYFEEYAKIKDVLLNWTFDLESKNLGNDSPKKNDHVYSENSNVNIPKFDIPHFFGNSEEWISFKNIFKASILDNKSLSDIEKLTYLQAAVKGEAAKLIRGFPINAENLNNCWEILSHRFENKRKLAISQINKIFNIKVQKANNSKQLLEIIDVCNEAMRNLSSLGLEENNLTDLMIINFLTSKIDDSINQRWELSLETDSFPNLETFKKFIEREARSVNEIKPVKFENKKFPPKVNTQHNSVFKKSSVNSTVIKPKVEANSYNVCLICKQQHAIFKCQAFNNMPVNERWKVVTEKKLCQNCLRGNHKLDQCRIGISCKNCSSRHHTLLHVYTQQPSTPETVSSTVINSCSAITNKNVLLSTALVKIKSKSGQYLRCKALIDSASQHSLLSRNCANLLNLPMHQSKHSLIGINQTVAETSLFETTFEVAPYFSDDYISVNALVVNNVTTQLPNFIIPNSTWPHLENLTLADPLFSVKDNIDLLIGADLFLSLIIAPPIIGPKGTPSALPTKLGHLLSGVIHTPVSNMSSVICHTITTIDDTLKSFWELEAVSKPVIPNDEDDECEKIFVNSHKRNSDGSYTVKLPFVDDHILGDSYSGALRRFYSLEKRLQSDDKLREKYTEFMKEYEDLGHMTKTDFNSYTPHYFLPHHGVINENSTTTKLRVVFDGSFKTTNNKSLNDVLLKGKKLQTDIFNILLKFRTFRVAFSSDITKMYRQIWVADEDTAYQQILWRKSPNEPIQVYRLRTVTYGTSSAPYLAIRALKQLCHDEKDKFPKATKLALDHFYVDDMLGGADSVTEAKALIQELQSLMSSGGFELRKWTSSHPEILETMPVELTASSLAHSFDNDATQKILGLYWDLKEDAFKIKAVSDPEISTKRQLLSVIARTFDPVGFISPSTIILKMLMQEIWKENLDWDDKLPNEILEKWYKFQSESHYLTQIKIPRYLQINNLSSYEVHGFCDASSKAYAAVVYLKVKSIPSNIFLVAAKTRVAPVQPVTLPRLELAGALLLSELVHVVKKSLNLASSSTYLWSDSTITLSWINNPPSKGNQFVQHRVSKINALTEKNSWCHIPGKFNPADSATRGIYPKQLAENSEWFHGPGWLTSVDDFTKNSYSSNENDNDLDSSSQDNPNDSVICISTDTDSNLKFIENFSSYLKLIRTVSWILRFHHNSKSSSKIRGCLQASELNNATIKLVKLLQEVSFKSDISLLKSKKFLPKSSRLIALHPFLDDEGILRIGGRLRHQQHLTFDQKYPILIPKNHHFTILLIRHYHLVNLHGSQELVLSLIRQKFWILDGKSTVRKILRQCVDCFKSNAKPIHQIMGDLPKERITPSRPFANTGIDFAGPVSTKCQHTRKPTIFKSYICLFICMCTKAVHLELISNLTTEAFLAALKRFISRRGYPSDIFSDNGKTFVGAAAHLKALLNLSQHSSIQDYSSQKNIKWHFIPPYSPNFGGVWEASIKLTKVHLTKTLKSAILTFEETATLLCQIEACVNSRPLFPLSPDPHDLSALTPGHFLVGCPLLQLPEINVNQSSFSLPYRWKILSQMQTHFWKQFSTSYLQSLQTRQKWRNHAIQILPGMLVLIKDPNPISSRWSLGRVTEVHPGHDGIVRAVSITTSSGLKKRSVSSIAILPLPTDDVSSGRPPEDVRNDSLIRP